MSISNLLTFNVSSVNRVIDGSDTDNFNYTFNLPSDISQITHVCITNIQIPKSWYVVRSPLNTFVLTENGVPTTITFPEGNYTNTQLFQTFQSLLNINSPNLYTYLVLEVNSTSLTIAPIPDLNQIQVSNNAGAGTISFDFNVDTSIIGFLLGYLAGTNIQVIGGTTIAPNPYNLNFETQIYLISNCVNSDSNDNNYSNNTLCVANCANVPFGSYIEQSYDMISNKKKFSQSGNFTFSFELVTSNQESSFFLNNVDMGFTISFFKYSPAYNYYVKSTELLSLIAQK